VAELTYLQELRDIHLPAQVSFWPLAWGFCLLIALIPLTVVIYHLLKPYCMSFKIKKSYLAKLEALAASTHPDTLSSIALLLKQAALMNYPRAEVAPLYGDKWLAFLSKSAKNIKLDDAKKIFSEALYQAPQQLDLKPALALAKSWLRQQRFRSCMN